MNKELLKDLLKDLRDLKQNCPTIDYNKYWDELNKVIEQENKLFTKEHCKLCMSNKDLYKFFDL